MNTIKETWFDSLTETRVHFGDTVLHCQQVRNSTDWMVWRSDNGHHDHNNVRRFTNEPEALLCLEVKKNFLRSVLELS